MHPTPTSAELGRLFASAFPELPEEKIAHAVTQLPTAQLAELQAAFGIHNRSLPRRFAFRIALLALGAIPFALRRHAIESAKRLRNRETTDDAAAGLAEDLAAIANSAACRFGLGLRGNAGPSAPEARGQVCLTYDIDTPACVAYLPRLLDMLAERNQRAVFHLLTGSREYPFEPAICEQILKRGHELGLHGHFHDIDFGNRSASHIRRQLQISLALLKPFTPFGFRSPALSIGPDLIVVLAELGFTCDSTVPACNPFYASNGFPFPYVLPDTDVVEFPVLLQDNTLFSDFHCSDDQALDVATLAIRTTTAISGVAVLNFHPCIAAQHEEFHGRFLDWLCEQSCPTAVFSDIAPKHAATR